MAVYVTPWPTAADRYRTAWELLGPGQRTRRIQREHATNGLGDINGRGALPDATLDGSGCHAVSRIQFSRSPRSGIRSYPPKVASIA